MQKTIFYILVFLFISSEVYAQKIIQKQWEGTAVDTILIASNDIYRVRITSEAIQTIALTTSVEGEFSEAIILEEFISGGTLRIDTGFSPYYNPKNDKLAAHKVMSVEMTLIVPKHIAVVVHSKIASVLATGDIAFLETVLENGHCILKNFKGDARLFSVFGDIAAEVQAGVGGRAISKEGVTNELKLEGNYFIEAESTNGTVSLLTGKQ